MFFIISCIVHVTDNSPVALMQFEGYAPCIIYFLDAGFLFF